MTSPNSQTIPLSQIKRRSADSSPAAPTLNDAMQGDAPSGKRVFIRTFGCQMNEYDSQKMVDVLRVRYSKITTVTDPEQADIILFNTCSVREKAQEKVFHDLGRIKHLKKNNPNLIIGVGGCVASQEGAIILQRAPYVDVVFGPQTLHRLPRLIDAKQKSGRSQMDIELAETEKFDSFPTPGVNGYSAFVSIMEGCSKFCSFCIVPYTRGQEVSRPLPDVLDEVAALTHQGVREITLLGQNVNGYRGLSKKGDASATVVDFAFLLECLAEMPEVKRIRYTSSHPLEMNERLIACHGKFDKLAPQLHLPVQSGSDRVLKAMKRGYSNKDYLALIAQLRLQRPDLLVSSDFIVGFPGERQEDFEATLRLIETVVFDNSFSFVYSKRPGTPAVSLDDDVSPEIKLQRLHQLQALLDEQNSSLGNQLVGRVDQVLFEGRSKKNPNEWTGRTSYNKVINFSGALLLDEINANPFVPVRITGVSHFTLRGELVAA